ncbi:glycosyltransferase family 2 protein [Amaricoccus solimangrovi]|uniref:Glycosyltransferase family 2 protein n=1 Tax=Amaricoccus solimangrovi TaxID=2589815 RepID=A0A501WIN1_9RHOB|nr:glycosyltransferase family 2 protein [Amaricoccus solimangrovi]TPE49743.1 glycosyltransferase family 2 protein [Amaricoccus solimangrovi]
MTDPTVLVVILNYRTAGMTLRAAGAAVRAMEGIPGGIVLVDNDSRDGSFERLRDAARGWERVRVIASGRNGGYGAGNNIGIRAGLPDGARPDYVHVLNSDAFPEAGAIAILRDHLSAHPEAGFAGSRILDAEGAPRHSAFRFPSIGGEMEAAARTGPVSRLLARHVIAPPIPEETVAVDWLMGASVMMRRAMLDEIGLFDEGFFLYYEETDLCLRAARAGWKAVYVPGSRVIHLGSVSTGMGAWRRTPRYWFDSRLRYFVKNHGPAYAAAATGAHLAGGLLWRARRLVTGQPPCDPPRFLSDLAAHALSRAVGLGSR